METKGLHLVLYVVLVLLVAGCVPLQPGVGATDTVPTVVVWPSATDTVTPRTTDTPLPTATSTPTATPSATPTPVVAERNGSPGGPQLITHDRTVARTGPGAEYPPSHELGGQTRAPILGRDAEGSWWAVPGPGDGPGPLAWVADGDVRVEGDATGMPVLWFVGHPYLPPADLCAVYHPGPGPAPVDVRLGPGEQYPVVALLGPERWAEALESRNGWHQIRTDDGEVGWVNGDRVGLSGLCGAPTPTAVADVPLILDPGAPPSNVCIASRPGAGVPYVDVHLGPGEQYAVIARLGNWAEVLKRSGGWYMIWIGPGDVGWVKETSVIASGPCTASPTPTPVADLPLILDPGAPPSGVCVASIPEDVPPVDVYLGPGSQYAAIARLGNWAEVLKRMGTWHMIWIVPGNVGWVQDASVTLSGPCPAALGP